MQISNVNNSNFEYKNYMIELKQSDKWEEITEKSQANGRKTSLERYGKEHQEHDPVLRQAAR